MKIVMYAGGYNYWGELSFDALKGNKQLGGGETAVLNLSLELAYRGHEVLIVGNVPREKTVGRLLRVVPADVDFWAIRGFNPDVLVLWDSAWAMRYNYNVPLTVVAYQLNDTQVGVFDYVIDAYFHPSDWHARRFAEVYGIPPDKQLANMTNATLEDRLAGNVAQEDRVRPPRVVYCSSPDRGLHHLLRIWPRIKEEVPDAMLDIYYDMTKWLSIVRSLSAQGRQTITTGRAVTIQNLLAGLQNQDVTYHGGVGKNELSAALAGTAVVAYPCDPVAPTEGFSMTILDSWAAGCQVVTTDADALGELWGGGNFEGITILPLPVNDDLWVKTVVSKLKSPVPVGGRAVPGHLTWRGLADRWLGVFQEKLTQLKEP